MLIISRKAIQRNLGMIIPLFVRFPPFWQNLGALALRQQVFFTNQQIAEGSQ